MPPTNNARLPAVSTVPKCTMNDQDAGVRKSPNGLDPPLPGCSGLKDGPKEACRLGPPKAGWWLVPFAFMITAGFLAYGNQA